MMKRVGENCCTPLPEKFNYLNPIYLPIEIFQKILLREEIYLISQTSKTHYEFIAKNTILKTRLMQAKIIKKIDSIFQAVNDKCHQLNLLRSKIVLQIKLNDPDFVQTIKTAKVIINTLNKQCKNEIVDDFFHSIVFQTCKDHPDKAIESLLFIENPIIANETYNKLAKVIKDKSKFFINLSIDVFDQLINKKIACLDYYIQLDNIKLLLSYSSEEAFKKIKELIELNSIYKEVQEIHILCVLAKAQSMCKDLGFLYTSTLIKKLVTEKILVEKLSLKDIEYLSFYSLKYAVELFNEYIFNQQLPSYEQHKFFCTIIFKNDSYNLDEKTFSDVLKIYKKINWNKCNQTHYEVFIKPISFFAFYILNLIENEKGLTVENIPEFFRKFFENIEDIFIETCVIIQIIKDIESKEVDTDLKNFINKHLLTHALSNLKKEELSHFDICWLKLHIAEAFCFKPDEATEFLKHVYYFFYTPAPRHLLKSYDYENLLELYDLLLQFSIKLKNKNDYFPKVVNQFYIFIRDLNGMGKVRALIKLASIMEQQERFDMAIDTAIRLDLDGRWTFNYLSKIASIDLQQTPQILAKIKATDWTWYATIDLNIEIKKESVESKIIQFLTQIKF